MSDDRFQIAGITGKAAVAPVGTAAPVAMGALNVAFKDVGWISDEGLTEAFDENRTTWTPWGAAGPTKSRITSVVKTFELTFWENNVDVLGLYYRKPTTPVPDVTSHITTIDETDDVPDPRAFVFDVLEGTNHVRLYVPKGEVTGRGNIVYKPDGLIGYPVTITAYRGSSGFTCRRIYLLDAVVAP